MVEDSESCFIIRENKDRMRPYGQWQFRIEDDSGNAVSSLVIRLDETVSFCCITLTSQVEFGNHTVYLRVCRRHAR